MNDSRGCVVVTGASSGMGIAVAAGLLERGFEVTMAVRNEKKGEAVRRRLIASIPGARAHVVPLELASLASIRAFGDELAERDIVPMALVNNAGVMCKEFALTTDGFEMSVGVNYVAPSFLSQLLIERFATDGGFRVVNTTSLTHRWGRVDEQFFVADPASHSRFGAYMRSKLGVLLFTAELAERMLGRGVIVNAVDPGVVNTGMITMNRWYDPLADLLVRPIIKSPEKGALPALLAVTNASVSGAVFSGLTHRPISRLVLEHPLRQWLWDATQREIDSRL